jgi:OHCU decarboxylase
VTVAELNALEPETARRELLRCCGSSRWAQAMMQARPFADRRMLIQTADAIWAALGPGDWHEAFAAHPRIGASGALPAWSRDEQSGVGEAARERFAGLNQAYESRFGHIFIVCASGRNGADLLRDLERRLGNDPDDELREAAEEQRKITQLRLDKLTT